MDSQYLNPYQPATKVDDTAPVASGTHRDRLAIAGLGLTLTALFASAFVAVMVTLDVVEVRWNASWPGYLFLVCVPATLIGWIVSIVACVQRRTTLTVAGVIGGLIASLLTAVLCAGIFVAGIAGHPV